jgi:molybdopterin-synthase adenylyltransferase
MSARQSRSVLVFGAGNLGGPAALTLASAGVGRITLVDAGIVAPQDLSSDPILAESDLGRSRSEAAARRLRRLFPAIEVESRAGLDRDALLDVVRSADVVVDASSDFAGMFAVNDAVVAAGRPLVHGGLSGLTVQLLTIVPRVTGCLRCLFEGPPPPGSEVGVLGPLAGWAGSLLGAEAIRLLDGRPGAYAGRLLIHEARPGRARKVPVKLRPDCTTCGVA